MNFMQHTLDCTIPIRAQTQVNMQDGELLVRVRFIAEVVATRCDSYKAGDLIEGQAVLEEYSILHASKVKRLGEAITNSGGRTLQFEKIRLNNKTFQVFYDGLEVGLTKKEYLLLKLLMEHPETVFTRDELLDLVWGYECYPVTRTVDNHILHLRQKLSGHLFETVRGVGYRLTARRL